MANSPHPPTTSFIDLITRLKAGMVSLEQILEQTTQALKKRGFQLSTDLGGLVRTLQVDFNQVETMANSIATKQHQMQELVRTSALINSSLDIDQVLAEVMDTVIALTGAERAYLLMRTDATSHFVPRQARNWDQETLEVEEIIFSRTIVSTAIKQKQPILTTNAQMDDRFHKRQSVYNYDLRSIVCIPLVLRDRVLGVLYADNRGGQGVFSQDSIPMLEAFANQAAIAIENAHTYTRVKSDLDTAQKEVQNLRIQIDQQKMREQIGEITETEYFQNLQTMVANIRKRVPKRTDPAAPSSTTE